VELSLYYKHAAWQAVKHGIIVEARAGKRAAAQTHYSQAVPYSMYNFVYVYESPCSCMLPLVMYAYVSLKPPPALMRLVLLGSTKRLLNDL
jgi:hypothetical protein